MELQGSKVSKSQLPKLQRQVRRRGKSLASRPMFGASEAHAPRLLAGPAALAPLSVGAPKVQVLPLQKGLCDGAFLSRPGRRLHLWRASGWLLGGDNGTLEALGDRLMPPRSTYIALEQKMPWDVRLRLKQTLHLKA